MQDIINSIKERKKIVIIVLLIVLISLITLKFINTINKSFALSNSSFIETKEIAINDKAKISFTNDTNYIYYNVLVSNKIEGENFYLESDAILTKLWNDYKNIKIKLEKSTDNKTFTNITEKELTINEKINLLSEEMIKEGINYFRISFTADNEKIEIDKRNIDINLDVKANTVFDYDFTEKSQEFIAPATGEYRVELWGAAGNYYPTNMKNEVGNGAYTAGTITLNENEKLYVYTGKNATDEGNFHTASFNAGSTAYGRDVAKEGYGHNSSSGGGATDVRLVSGEWNNINSLRSRIMVAAGGGGTHYYRAVDDYYAIKGEGGAGGGLIGYRGYQSLIKTTSTINYIFTEYDGTKSVITKLNQQFAFTGGGSQTAGGKNNPCNHPRCSSISSGKSGSFGVGGSGAGTAGGGGGAGGYYGGGGGGQAFPDDSDSGMCHSSAAGGSSYISGHTGSIAITSATNTSPKQGCTESGTTPANYAGTTDKNCSIHYSGKTFTDTVMIDGEGYNWTNVRKTKTTMPKYPTGTYTSGNSGSGAAKITGLSLSSESKLTKTGKILVITNYVDEEGKKLVETVQIGKDKGETYTTKEKTILNYELIKTPENVTGTVGEKDIIVNYVYRKQGIVQYKSDDCGEITGKTLERITYGKTPTGTIDEPQEGYEILNWTADKEVTLKDETTKAEGAALTLEEIKNVVVNSNITFTAHHEIKTYKVNYKSDENGRITGQIYEQITHEKNPTGTQEKANEGYHIKNWTSVVDLTLNDKTTIPKGTPITEEQIKEIIVTKDITLTVTHEKNKYKVEYKSDENGKITGKQKEEVEHGNNVTGTEEEANEGYCNATGWTANKDVVLINNELIEHGSIITNEQLQKIKVTTDLILTVIHERCYGNITILKLDKESEKPVEQVEFKLYTEEDKEAIDINGNTIVPVTTGKNGIATFENVMYGTYKIKETKANSWYKTLKEEIEFKLNEKTDALNIENTRTSIVVTNVPIKITLEKQDQETKTKLDEAEFEIRNEKGKIFTICESTNEEQIIYIPNGKYSLKEIKAPERYEKLKKDLEFEIDTDGEIKIKANKMYELDKEGKIIIYNKEKEEYIEVPKTDTYKNASKIIIGLILLVIGLLLIMIKKIKATNM